jgi:tellurite resistance protein
MPTEQRPERIPLNTLAIAFGLAGLAQDWSLAHRYLGAPLAIADGLWAVVTISWLWLLVAHLVRGRRSAQSLAAQLRHPAQGPIAAIIPIVAMLIGANLYRYWPAGGRIMVVLAVIAAGLFAAWLLSRWAGGGVPIESVHGAYLLPTAAAGLVAAACSSQVGFASLAIGALIVGLAFSIIVFLLILARLMFLPPLPDALAPTMAILVAPPAVAGEAWFAINGGVSDAVALGLAAVTVLLGGMQLGLVRRYRTLSFTLGFWSFTFPYEAVAGVAIVWLGILAPAGWRVYGFVVLGAITAFVLAIAARSLMLVLPGRSGGGAGGVAAGEPGVADEELEVADTEVEEGR